MPTQSARWAVHPDIRYSAGRRSAGIVTGWGGLVEVEVARVAGSRWHRRSPSVAVGVDLAGPESPSAESSTRPGNQLAAAVESRLVAAADTLLAAAVGSQLESQWAVVRAHR